MKEYTVTYNNLICTHNHMTVEADTEAEAIRLVAQADTMGWNFRVSVVVVTSKVTS